VTVRVAEFDLGDCYADRLDLLASAISTVDHHNPWDVVTDLLPTSLTHEFILNPNVLHTRAIYNVNYKTTTKILKIL
jgi:hypothetical protein